jgi:hypothetical protein
MILRDFLNLMSLRQKVKVETYLGNKVIYEGFLADSHQFQAMKDDFNRKVDHISCQDGVVEIEVL